MLLSDKTWYVDILSSHNSIVFELLKSLYPNFSKCLASLISLSIKSMKSGFNLSESIFIAVEPFSIKLYISLFFIKSKSIPFFFADSLYRLFTSVNLFDIKPPLYINHPYLLLTITPPLNH